jgi:hypothetical protein
LERKPELGLVAVSDEISTTDFRDSRANSCSIILTKAGIVTKHGDFLADVPEKTLADGDNPF